MLAHLGWCESVDKWIHFYNVRAADNATQNQQEEMKSVHMPWQSAIYIYVVCYMVHESEAQREKGIKFN